MFFKLIITINEKEIDYEFTQKIKKSALFSAAQAITKNNQEKLQEIQDYRVQKIEATAK